MQISVNIPLFLALCEKQDIFITDGSVTLKRQKIPKYDEGEINGTKGKE